MRLKRRKLAGILSAVVMCLFFSSGCVSAAADETEELQENQRTAVIHVVSITGNELTYYEEEAETETTEAKTEAESETAEAETETAGTEAESETAEAETENAEADVNPGQMQQPGEGFDSGQMQQAGEDFNPGQMELPEDFDPSQMQASGRGFTPGSSENGDFASNRMRMSEEIETTTVYLPVSVVVHTDTGEEKTFSILEAGDELEVLYEKNADGEDVIIEIWMRDTGGNT